MKKLVFLTAICLFLAAAEETQAQGLLKKLSNKAKETIEKKVEKKAEDKVEEEVGKKVDETFESMEKETEAEEQEKQEQEATNEPRGMGALKGMLGKMGMDTTPVEVEDNYTFTSNVKMLMESYKSNGELESKGDINSFFNESSNTFAYEITDQKNKDQGEAFMIYDQKNKASIILSEKDGKKQGIVTGINLSMSQENMQTLDDVDDQDLTALNANIKKTGKTKTILGYKCSEYKYKDKEVESTFWMTKDKVWKVNNMMSAIYKSSQYSSGFPAGFMMEMESNNLQTKEKNILKVTEVNEHIKKTVSLSDYEVMNMGSINMEGME